MDEDLKKLIESTAAETRGHFDAKAAEMQRHSDATAAETRSHFDAKSAELHGYFDSKTAEMRTHFDAKTAETRRHFEAVAERLESKFQLVAEGVAACNDRIDRVDMKIDRLDDTMKAEFADVRSMIKFSHHDLDRRLRSLEDTVSDLQSRVERLEGTH